MNQIQFNAFPVNFNVPGFYAEFDPSQAVQGLVPYPQKILLIGQMLATGSATPEEAVLVSGSDEVATLAGRGSMLHHMAIAARAANAFTPLYILPLEDDAGGTASTRDLTLTGPSTAAGSIVLYTGGRRYAVGVASGVSAATVATAIADEINADPERLVNAAAAAEVLTLTARHKGVDAGNIRVSLNRLTGERLPSGITVTIDDLTVGTVNPDITAAIAGLGEQWYPTFASAYTDAASLGILEVELADRFGPVRQIEGHAYAGVDLSYAAAIALAESRNSPHVSPVDASDILDPGFIVAASVAAKDAGESDPARPRQTLELNGLLSAAETGRRSLSERNALIEAGISTVKVDGAGAVRIEYLTTTYRENSAELPDAAYKDVETLRTLELLRFQLRARFATRYPRHKLGRDGTIGPDVMTPKTARGELVALYLEWMQAGYVEGGEALSQFKRDLITEIDASNPNQLNSLLPPDLINQFRVGAFQFQFRR